MLNYDRYHVAYQKERRENGELIDIATTCIIVCQKNTLVDEPW